VIDWTAVRARYPAALRKAYLDTACKGIPPPEAISAIEEYCRFVRESPLQSVTEETILVNEHLARARRGAAELIGAHEDEIALVESTQHGLNIVADLLRTGPGDRVVASDLEFFGTVLPWRGAALELVPHREGRVEVEDLEAAIDSRTRAVVVSSVQEVNGFLVDLPALSRVCRERGVALVVDAAQHVGPVPIDVRQTPVDFLAAGGHKWLCSPFGLGFVYVRRELLAELEPSFRGYLSLQEPPEGWAAYLADPGRTPVDDLGFVGSARSLETGGTTPALAAAALTACLGVLLRLGSGRIEARVQELVASLLDGLDELGLGVVSPREHRSGIVAFHTADEPRLVEELAAKGVGVSLRYTSGAGGIRVSPYFYNDESDLERLLSAVSGSEGSRARRRAGSLRAGRGRAGRPGSPA
jgi:cysteine desulfurase/selenocysteine lyase